MIVDNDDWRSMIWLILTAVNKNYIFNDYDDVKMMMIVVNDDDYDVSDVDDDCYDDNDVVNHDVVVNQWCC